MLSEREFNEVFAKNLITQMEAFNFNQADISRLLNVSTSTVSSWVNAQRTPRMDKVDALCGIFHCNRDDLIVDGCPMGNYERKIVDALKMLNDEGQQKVADYIADLINSGRYKKHDFDEVVEA